LEISYAPFSVLKPFLAKPIGTQTKAKTTDAALLSPRYSERSFFASSAKR
jgi:hypothetical protein